MDVPTAQTAFDQAQAGFLAAQEAAQVAHQALTEAEAVLTQAQADLAAQVTAGSAGAYSSVDLMLQRERFAGKSAAIDWIKANPTGTEDQAVAAWTPAAIAATGLPAPIVPPGNYLDLFTADLAGQGLITEQTFAALAAWVVATDKNTIMAN